MMMPMSAEATVARNYIDWIISLPWGKKSKTVKDIKVSEDILNKSHYGMEKVKERVVEYLAVQKRTQKLKGPILCLVGPPGVGKTSLARSIAESTGRPFVRMSLGGIRDESEIRSDISTVAEANAKYHPYLKRQEEDIKLLKKEEGQKIPHNFDFSVLQGLSAEVREKLLNVKPQTIAQVKRIPGQRINITHAKYYHYL